MELSASQPDNLIASDFSSVLVVANQTLLVRMLIPTDLPLDSRGQSIDPNDWRQLVAVNRLPGNLASSCDFKTAFLRAWRLTQAKRQFGTAACEEVEPGRYH